MTASHAGQATAEVQVRLRREIAWYDRGQAAGALAWCQLCVWLFPFLGLVNLTLWWQTTSSQVPPAVWLIFHAGEGVLFALCAFLFRFVAVPGWCRVGLLGVLLAQGALLLGTFSAFGQLGPGLYATEWGLIGLLLLCFVPLRLREAMVLWLCGIVFYDFGMLWGPWAVGQPSSHITPPMLLQGVYPAYHVMWLGLALAGAHVQRWQRSHMLALLSSSTTQNLTIQEVTSEANTPESLTETSVTAVDDVTQTKTTPLHISSSAHNMTDPSTPSAMSLLTNMPLLSEKQAPYQTPSQLSTELQPIPDFTSTSVSPQVHATQQDARTVPKAKAAPDPLQAIPTPYHASELVPTMRRTAYSPGSYAQPPSAIEQECYDDMLLSEDEQPTARRPGLRLSMPLSQPHKDTTLASPFRTLSSMDSSEKPILLHATNQKAPKAHHPLGLDQHTVKIEGLSGEYDEEPTARSLQPLDKLEKL